MLTLRLVVLVWIPHRIQVFVFFLCTDKITRTYSHSFCVVSSRLSHLSLRDSFKGITFTCAPVSSLKLTVSLYWPTLISTKTRFEDVMSPEMVSTNKLSVV